MFGGAIDGDEGRSRPTWRAALGGDAHIERTVYPTHGVGLIDVLASERATRPRPSRSFSERWGVAAAETLAIGDNWNDREMLSGPASASSWATPTPGCCALGLPVLPTNDEDGVAVAIERHVLGR